MTRNGCNGYYYVDISVRVNYRNGKQRSPSVTLKYNVTHEILCHVLHVDGLDLREISFLLGEI